MQLCSPLTSGSIGGDLGQCLSAHVEWHRTDPLGRPGVLALPPHRGELISKPGAVAVSSVKRHL